MKANPINYAVGYARFSPRPDATETESIAKQHERIEEYCRRMGYTLLKIYDEPDTSGKDDPAETNPEKFLDARPVLETMLNEIQKGMVVVVRWRSRIARSVYAQNYVRRRCTKKHCRVEATDEPNGELPADRFVQDVLAGVAEMQRWDIIIATKRAMKRHQYTDGRRMTRIDRCPFGKMPDPYDADRIIDCPEEQRAIARIVELRQNGLGYRRICSEMNHAKIPLRGKTWKGAAMLVKRILGRIGVEKGNGEAGEGETPPESKLGALPPASPPTLPAPPADLLSVQEGSGPTGEIAAESSIWTADLPI